MAVQCSVFIATSLDGYIARTDGSIDWLSSAAGAAGGEDFGYADFIATIDAIVMGRNTYDVVRSFPRWPYGKRPVFVLSSSYPAGGKALSETVAGTSSGPERLAQQISSQGLTRVYVDGGKTIQSFGGTGRDINLRHIETKSYPNGFVQSRYEVAPAQ